MRPAQFSTNRAECGVKTVLAGRLAACAGAQDQVWLKSVGPASESPGTPNRTRFESSRKRPECGPAVYFDPSPVENAALEYYRPFAV